MDAGRPAGMALQDFVDLPDSVTAGLRAPHVAALRLYTSNCFRSLNTPLRSAGEGGAPCSRGGEITRDHPRSPEIRRGGVPLPRDALLHLGRHPAPPRGQRVAARRQREPFATCRAMLIKPTDVGPLMD